MTPAQREYLTAKENLDPDSIPRQERASPMTTISDIAVRLDAPAREVLDAVKAAGVRIFWHEGQSFLTHAYLESYIALQYATDPVPEIQFDLTPETAERIAAALKVTTAEVLA